MRYSTYLIFVFYISSVIHGTTARNKWAPNTTGAERTSLTTGRHLSSHPDIDGFRTFTSKDPDARFVSSLKRGHSKESARSASASGRVAFGNGTTTGQFPTVVYLKVGDSMCTGTIITKWAVLTAAHCVKTDSGDWLDVNKIKVYYGSIIWKKNTITTVDVSFRSSVN